MIFSSGLGIVLSLVFGLLLLALLAELYYLLWWKRLTINQNNTSIQHSSPSHAKQIFYLFCWNKPHPLSSSHNNINANTNTNANANRLVSTGDETSSDIEIGPSKDFFLRAVGDDGGVEAELMRLHNLSGPPRFLFTIKEETKEDLESEDRGRKGSRTKSLSDLILAVDNPFITTPLSSPPPPLKLATTIKTTNSNPLDCYSRHGFNPLFESVSVEAELDRLRSSPPPKFKFLRDAEEKLYRRILEEAERINRKTTTANTLNGGGGNGGDFVVQQINSYPAASARTSVSSDEGETGRDASSNLIKIVVGKSVTGNHSTSSQVLPLPSSPTISFSGQEITNSKPKSNLKPTNIDR